MSCHRRLRAWSWSFCRQFASAGSPPDLDIVHGCLHPQYRLPFSTTNDRNQIMRPPFLWLAILPWTKRQTMQRLPTPLQLVYILIFSFSFFSELKYQISWWTFWRQCSWMPIPGRATLRHKGYESGRFWSCSCKAGTRKIESKVCYMNVSNSIS